MKRIQIPTPEQMRREIERLHRRSRDYGIDPFKIDPEQTFLGPDFLAERIEQKRLFFDLAIRQMNDLHQITSEGGFTLILVDAEGYILHMLGSAASLEFLAPTNCSPGYRWTEQDVGTTAIALCLARRIPVQITEKDFFCSQREKSFVTNSASPIFGPDDRLLGVVAMTGGTEQVHRHTMGMMLTSARAIENEFKVLKKKDEILVKNRFMQHLIESIDQGVMILDRQGKILQCNTPGRKILQTREDLVGRFIQELTGPSFHWQEALKTSSACVDREVFFQLHEDKTVQSLCTLHAIHDATGNMEGLVFSFTKIDRIRKIVNKMAGSQALFTLNDIIGTSPAIEKARQLAKQATQNSSNVLITGETGTGKELFAQSIHNYGSRHNRPYMSTSVSSPPPIDESRPIPNI